MPQYLDRLPVRVPVHRVQKHLQELAEEAAVRGFSEIQQELDTHIYELYQVSDRGIAMIEAAARR